MNYSIDLTEDIGASISSAVRRHSGQGQKIVDFQTGQQRPLAVVPGVAEQLLDEVRFSGYLARRENERRAKGREAIRAVSAPAPNRNKKPRRRAKSTPAMLWLRNVISSLVYGEMTPDGVRPSQKIIELIGRWNLGLSLRKLANYQLADHFQGAATCYFFGNGNPDDEYTLLMIDIDVQKSQRKGSPKGALAFAEHLRRVRFPNLYFERSTGGKGVHAYVLVRKLGDAAKEVNDALRRLESWLRAEARRVSADIELVEVKGTCTEITFRYGMMESVKYGSFAKLPREAHRFEEWRATTVVSLRELQGTQYDVAQTVGSPAVTTAPHGVVSGVKPNKQIIYGSVSGKYVTAGELDCIPRYEALYRRMTEGKNLKIGKFAVTAHDFAVAPLLLRFFKTKPNPDGSLPTSRMKGLWTGLFDAGDVHRPWNHRRWKAIRDFLSQQGHLHWLDNRYEYGHKVNGKYVKGIACKFSITDEFADMLDTVVVVKTVSTGGASFVDTTVARIAPKKGTGTYLLPERFPIWAEKERLFWKKALEASETLFAA